MRRALAGTRGVYRRRGGHELRLFWGNPPQAAIAAILGAPCEFAVAHLRGVLFLLYRFEGGIDSSAAPYTRGRTGRTRTPPGPGPAAGPAAAEHDALSVYLVDADTGILRGRRTVALSPPMLAALEAALREQRAKPFRGDYAYRREISWAHALYPSAEAMLPRALAYCRCEG